MATNTTHYGFTKPGVNDYVDISVLNANFDNLDTVIYNNQLSVQAALDDLAPEYDATATYSVGDYVTYNKTLYKCTTAIATAEAFDDTKWTAVKVGGELKSHDARISDLEAGVELEGEATNSFDDGIDSYFKKVVSTIVPVQAGTGTPSPTNVRAISGFTECAVLDRQINQWDEQWEKGNINTTDGTNTPADNRIRSTNYIRVDHQTYYIKKSIGMVIYFYNINLDFMSYTTLANNTSEVLNIPEGCDYIRFVLSTSYGTTYNNDISVNYPATDTDYHAYNGTTATISFGSAGTVYGGYVDLISGKLVATYGCTDLGSETPTYTATGWNYNINGIKRVTSGGYKNNNFGEQYRFVSSNDFDKVVGTAYQIVNSDIVQVYNGESLIKPVGKICYELATPIESQLTPAQLRSLVGANRLTSSTGEVIEVEYIKNKTIAWLLDLIRA